MSEERSFERPEIAAIAELAALAQSPAPHDLHGAVSDAVAHVACHGDAAERIALMHTSYPRARLALRRQRRAGFDGLCD